MTQHYLKVAAEALLAGVVAFGVTYQASNDMKSSVIAGCMAAVMKAFPSAVTSAH